MANPTFATSPTPFDPPDCARPLYNALTATQRSRLVRLHQQGAQTWSASLDPALQDAGLVLKLSGQALVSPWGCDLAVWAHYQGVTP